MAWVVSEGTVTAWSSRSSCWSASLNGPLHRGEVRVIRHDRLGEGGELHTLVAKRNNLLDNLFHRPLAAVQHRTDLNGCGLDDCHLNIPFVLDATP